MDRHSGHSNNTFAQSTISGKRQFTITKQFKEWVESWEHVLGTN